MSRVGKQPIAIPAGVTVSLENDKVHIKGPKGQMDYILPEGIAAELQGNELTVHRSDNEGPRRALHGLARSLLANMVKGVTMGFDRTLELKGTGYRASKSGNNLVLNVGYSHPVEVQPPDGIEIEVPNPTTVVVKGIDKQAVGQIAANIRAIREPEPYLGKGIRYAGEKVRRKVGKAGK